jgi:hypothetical protein
LIQANAALCVVAGPFRKIAFDPIDHLFHRGRLGDVR